MMVKVKKSPHGSIALKPVMMVDWQVVYRSATEIGGWYPNDYLHDHLVSDWTELIDPTQMQLVFIPRTNNDPS